MGTNATYWAVAKARDFDLPDKARYVSKRSGWLLFEQGLVTTVTELRRFAARWSAHTNGAVLGSSIRDSDFAIVVGANLGEVIMEAVVNPRSAKSYGEGELTTSLMDNSARMSRWSLLAPEQVSARWVEKLLTKQWDFAEDAVAKLWEKLGLDVPETHDETVLFEGAKILNNNGTVRPSNVSIDLETSRFVLGYGDDFVGIWDRTNPGPPVLQYPSTAEGSQAAYLKWHEMVTGQPLT